jgi:DNA-directed RNA polymerase specialized sigma24 family protein
MRTKDRTNDTETTTMKIIDKNTSDTTDTSEALGTPESSNDNGTSVATPDTTHMLADREVVHYIIGTLRRYHVQREDLADAVGDVQADALEAARRGRMPANREEWKALATTIAARQQIDRLREEEVRDKYDAGLVVEDPDAYEKPTLHWEQRDPVDTKRYLQVLKELFDSGQMPEDGAEILWGEAEGVPQKETAEELGIGETTVSNRLSRMRATFYRRLAELGMLVILGLIAVALGGPLGGVASWEGAKPDVPVHIITPRERAAELRHEAIAACETGDWEACLARLDRAAKLDPAGEEAPEVLQARRMAEEGEHEQRQPRLEAKPR